MLIVAGGTGGHIFPALALARELVRREIEVVWVGRPEGIERDIVAKAGYDFAPVVASKFSGTGIGDKLVSWCD